MRLTVAQALVRFLGAQSVSRDGRDRPFFAGCLGILGHGNIAGLGQALQQHPESLQYIAARNEQAMVHIAAGYAKQSNRLGTFACTTSIGPGATNLVTGAALATVNRLPVLLLPADTFATRRSDPVLQQLERRDDATTSVNDALRPVCRFFDRVERPEQLFAAAQEAMRVLTDPAETGAVTIALPQDVQVEPVEIPEGFLEPAVWPIERRPPEPAAVARAVELLGRSERPLIVAGGGVLHSEAASALRGFAEASGIPVAETQAGRGALASSHALCLGGVGATGTAVAAEVASAADLVIGIGTRWSDFTTASRSAFADPGLKLLNLNVNRGDALKLGGLPLVADARAGLEALRAGLGGWRVRREWSERVAGASGSWRAEREVIVADTGAAPPSQPEIIGAVNEAAGDDGVVVCAAGSMPGELHRLWDASGPGSYHVEYGYSCMGYELPGGIGAKLADPDRRVFVLVGDGSWLMMHGELVTAVLRDIAITVILVDNGGFSSIGALSRSLGQGGFGTILAGPSLGPGGGAERLDGDDVVPAPVDLAASASALGATAIRVADVAGLREALRESAGASGPVVIRVPADRFAETPSYGWWDVPVAEVSESEHVDRARALHGAALAGRRTSMRRTT